MDVPTRNFPPSQCGPRGRSADIQLETLSVSITCPLLIVQIPFDNYTCTTLFGSTHAQQSPNNRRRRIQVSQWLIVLILFIKDCTFLFDNVKQVKLAKTSTLWVRFNWIKINKEIECPLYSSLLAKMATTVNEQKN